MRSGFEPLIEVRLATFVENLLVARELQEKHER
jgi:hypothetical protein